MSVTIEINDNIYEVCYSGVVTLEDLQRSHDTINKILAEKRYYGIYDHSDVMYTQASLQAIQQFPNANTILLHPNLIAFSFVIPNLRGSPRAKALLEFCVANDIVAKAYVCKNAQQARAAFSGVKEQCPSINILRNYI